MFKVMSKLLMSNQIKFTDGRLILFERDIFFIPTAAFVQILKILIDTKNEEVLYRAAKGAGVTWFKNMSLAYPGMKQTEAINWGMDIVTLAGWGKISLNSINLDSKNSIFVMTDSLVAKLYGKTNCSVDHLFRGLVAGAVSYILNQEVDAFETHCVAKGDPVCRFTVSPVK